MLKISATLLFILVSMSAHSASYTLGQIEDDQGTLAQAKMTAEIADAQAKGRISTHTAVEDADQPNRPADPEKDFQPYGFYQFGARICADFQYRNVLYTRCVGDHDAIDGWKLSKLSEQSATFAKGNLSRVVNMGVDMNSATPPPPSNAGFSK